MYTVIKKASEMKDIADNYNSNEKIINEQAIELLHEAENHMVSAAESGEYNIYFRGLSMVIGEQKREKVRKRLIKLLKDNGYEVCTPAGSPFYILFISWEEK